MAALFNQQAIALRSDPDPGEPRVLNQQVNRLSPLFILSIPHFEQANGLKKLHITGRAFVNV